MTDSQEGKVKELLAKHTTVSDPSGWNIRTVDVPSAMREALAEGRKQGLTEAITVCGLRSHECWKNLSHEEHMNRIDNAMQYDIVRGEFTRLAAELRRLSSPAVIGSNPSTEPDTARKEE